MDDQWNFEGSGLDPEKDGTGKPCAAPDAEGQAVREDGEGAQAARPADEKAAAAPGDMIEDTAGEAAGDTPEDTAGGASEDTVGDTPEDTVGSAPEDAVGDTPEDTVGSASDEVVGDETPDTMTDGKENPPFAAQNQPSGVQAMTDWWPDSMKPDAKKTPRGDNPTVDLRQQADHQTNVAGHDTSAAQDTAAQTPDGSYHWVNPRLGGQTQDGMQNQWRDEINGGAQAGWQSGNTGRQNADQASAASGSRDTANRPAAGGNTQDGAQNQPEGRYQDWNSMANRGRTQSGTGYHENSHSGGWSAYTTGNPHAGERKYGEYRFAGDGEHPEPGGAQKPPAQKKPAGAGKKILATIGLAVLFGLVAGGVMLAVTSLGGNDAQYQARNSSSVQVPTVETPQDDETDASGQTEEDADDASDTETDSSSEDSEYTVADVAEKCVPSVVSITNASVTTVQNYFGGTQEYESESSGSGIIVGQNDKELLIATNNHVVTGADTISVAFVDQSVCEAQIKGTDSDNDLAVIAVMIEDMTEETLGNIRIAAIGDSDSLKVGEQVVAIGNALGYGQSVTSGWVSALDREVEDEDGKVTSNLIQTDAAINPGNSGGPLLNMKGELIGINSAKAAATEVEGMGYAIPISVAEPILDELMNRETRYKVEDETKSAYIGVTCLTQVDSTYSELYGIPAGAFVRSVEEDGPADQAGIIQGDVIVKFDGITINNGSELVERLTYYEAGETVEVVISRAENGQYVEQTVTVTLGKKSEMKQSAESDQ